MKVSVALFVILTKLFSYQKTSYFEQPNSSCFSAGYVACAIRASQFSPWLHSKYAARFKTPPFMLDWSKAGGGTCISILLLMCGDVESNPGPKRSSADAEMDNFECQSCNKTFQRLDSLNRHNQTVHQPTTSEPIVCPTCGQSFSRSDSLKRHLRKKRPCRTVTVVNERREAAEDSTTRVTNETAEQVPASTSTATSTHTVRNENTAEHNIANTEIENSVSREDPTENNVASTSTAAANAFQSTADDDIVIIMQKNAFDGKARSMRLKFCNQMRDPRQALEKICPILIEQAKGQLSAFKGLKLSFCLHVVFFKPTEPSTKSTGYFWSAQQKILSQVNCETDVVRGFPKLLTSIDEYLSQGSGWVILRIEFVDINICVYQPLKGSCHVELPDKIKNNNGLLNIQNNDNKCFLWCVLAHLHKRVANPHRTSNYARYEDSLHLEGIKFPMKLNKIKKFEDQNDLAINVYGFESFLYPLYISERNVIDQRHINLVLYKEHFCLIRDLDRLLSKQRGGNRKKYFCARCLFPFYSRQRLQEHQHFCKAGEPSRLIPPRSDNISFGNIQRMLRQPLVVYADFECFTVPVEDESVENSVVYQHHVPCSFGYIVHENCCGNKRLQAPVLFRGEHVIQQFLLQMVEIMIEYSNRLTRSAPLIMSTENEAEFHAAHICQICKSEFTDDNDKVHDHCHLCGEFRGAAHNLCNQQYRLSRQIVVIFHNLRKYDGHLIMQEMGTICREFHLQLDCVAKSMEDYLGFTVSPLRETHDNDVASDMEDSDDDDDETVIGKTWRIRFIDSLQFLSSSLEQVAKTMNHSDFFALSSIFEHIELLTRKGVFPYDLLTDESFFYRTSLPARSEFYNKLNKSDVTEAEYQHAQNIWNEFNMNTMGEYHDLYLKTDVLILCDSMEKFRNLCLSNYELDPVHYLTLPSLAFDACLKMSKVNLCTIKDPDMYTFFENGIRGGISVISHRYAEANNRFCDDHDVNKETSYIMYLDMNNLYGTAMTFPLPTNCLKWMSDAEIEQTDFLSISKTNEIGYALEVDLAYPEHLHKDHNDYPLAPTKRTVNTAELSPFCENLRERLKLNAVSTKLIADLNTKTRYVIHYINLQLYVELGMRILKIHRAIKFHQSAWLKPYIDLNTRLRSCAISNFERDLFKLLNNAVFGKTMENVRKYKEVKLITQSNQLVKWTASPRFKRLAVFSTNLVGLLMSRKTTCLDKPIYVGFSILDLSKKLMYDFHYKHMKPLYHDQLKLLFTDTDSFIYLIKTVDVYCDMKLHINMYDTSNYPTDHELYSLLNKKVLGKMKDETDGTAITKFVGLRSKMYSFITATFERKRAKGIKKSVVETEMTFFDYFNTLKNLSVQKHAMNIIRSKSHQIYSITMNKRSLSAYDDKRYILEDGISTLAYGHQDIELASQT